MISLSGSPRGILTSCTLTAASTEWITACVPCRSHRIADYSTKCLVELKLADLTLHLCNPVALDCVQDLLCVLTVLKLQGVDGSLSSAAAISQLHLKVSSLSCDVADNL